MDKASPANVVEADYQIVDVNTITVIFAVIPTSNQYRVVVMG